jgi:GNAT superfamily N-acetyltransferase
MAPPVGTSCWQHGTTLRDDRIMLSSVRRAEQADLGHLAVLLASGFADDPVISHLVPADAESRSERLRRFFDLALQRSQPLGGVWTSTDGTGAAVWFPPSHWRAPLARTVADVPQYARIFGRRLRRAGRLQARLNRHHPQEPHWYLLYLAVLPERRGHGVGSELLQPMLDLCDGQGVGAYLEATSAANRQLYVRHGFADQGPPVAAPGHGPPLHSMWRQPRSSAEATVAE